MSLPDDIRAYAMRPLRSLRYDRNSMLGLEHCLCESFLTPNDWDEHGLWSIEWRTFALIVAESLDIKEPSESKAQLICRKCGVDRYQKDCPGPRVGCPMVATALNGSD